MKRLDFTLKKKKLILILLHTVMHKWPLLIHINDIIHLFLFDFSDVIILRPIIGNRLTVTRCAVQHQA